MLAVYANTAGSRLAPVSVPSIPRSAKFGAAAMSMADGPGGRSITALGGQRAAKDVEELVDIRLGHIERRGDADRGIGCLVDEQTVLARASEHVGCLFTRELNSRPQAHRANFRDLGILLFGKLFEPSLDPRTHATGVASQVLIEDFLQYRMPRRTHERVTRERRAVIAGNEHRRVILR